MQTKQDAHMQAQSLACCAALHCVLTAGGNEPSMHSANHHCYVTARCVTVAAGETFHQAACRGLQEELGISAVVPDVPLGPMHKRSLVVPGLYVDNELVQSYRVDGFDGQVRWARKELPQLLSAGGLAASAAAQH